jgi:hypothetical protein
MEKNMEINKAKAGVNRQGFGWSRPAQKGGYGINLGRFGQSNP